MSKYNTGSLNGIVTVIKNKIGDFIKKGDRVAIANINTSNASIINEIAKEHQVDIVGGYSPGLNSNEITVADKKIPVFTTFIELLENSGKEKQPNKIAICLDPDDICDEIEEIKKVGRKIIDTIFIVPRISSVKIIEKINRVCLRAGFDLFFNFLPFNWEHVYNNNNMFDDLGWYSKEIDPDLEKTLEKKNICEGSFLDLGTGPGTQATELAKKGFQVTGTDISLSAIHKLKKQSTNVHFLMDDILNSKINRKFDYIFDRGCFHTIQPSDREIYCKQVYRLLSENGLLFLKCFSTRESLFRGPYRFSTVNIRTIFKDFFYIEEIFDTVFNHEKKPDRSNALFVVMKKKLVR